MSKARKVMILGTAYSARLAPCWDDPTWEVWGSSRVQPYVTRRDRWFETHNLDHLRATQGDEWTDGWIKDMKDFEKRLPCPLYMFFPKPDLFGRVHDINADYYREKFGSFFLTSSMAWQLAIFLDEVAPNGKAPKGTKLGMYGVELDFGTEYRGQRSGVRHFLQLARHFGIETVLFNAGGLVYEPTPYPFWTEDPLVEKLKFRLNGIAKDMDAILKSRTHCREKYYTAKGRLQEASEAKPPDHDRIDALTKELDQALETGEQIQNKIEFMEGAKSELEYMLDYQTP